MPKMVITHGVVDVDNWLKGKAERADAITAMGCSNVVDYVAEDGSKAIAVTADAHDPAAVMATIELPARRARGHHGTARSRATADGLHREVARRLGRLRMWSATESDCDHATNIEVVPAAQR